jgi:hypothetical protein
VSAVLCDQTRTARKPHVCIWCGEPISPGERYRYQRISFDRAPQSNSWHPECFGATSQDDLLDGFEPHVQERGGAQEAVPL